MSQDQMSVNLKERKVLGKGLHSLRSEGMVPAVIHNHGQESIHVMASEKELIKVYQEAGKHHPLELHIGSQNYLALIKDVRIRLEGEIPAEKVGLMVLHQLDTVEVEALPQNLPDELVADASKLAELHDKITVADLPIPSGVTVLTELDYPIATVVETKAQLSEEAEEAAEGDETAEGQAAEGAEADAAGQQAADKPGE
jgi:large subunit ribosomal protein L25